MSLRFAVVHEAGADFTVATDLADRVLQDAVEWLDEDLLPHQREWLATAVTGQRLTWTNLPHLAQNAGIRAHGHFDGEPGLPDAAAARRAILFLRYEFPDLAAIVLVRDQDDQPERRGGLEQARSQPHGGVTIVVGLAVVERESWVICGFDPVGDEESGRLIAERQGLGFDPRERSHHLTACKNNQAPRSPKRVLSVLSANDWDRECRCWQGTSMDVLRQRGAENGLAAYLDEVQHRLAPLIGHVPNT